jgi:hypothetical protein
MPDFLASFRHRVAEPQGLRVIASQMQKEKLSSHVRNRYEPNEAGKIAHPALFHARRCGDRSYEKGNGGNKS